MANTGNFVGVSADISRGSSVMLFLVMPRPEIREHFSNLLINVNQILLWNGQTLGQFYASLMTSLMDKGVSNENKFNPHVS